MYLGKVIGTVVCSVKDDGLAAKKLLIVQPLYGGGSVVAVDAVGCGFGETVYVCRGKEASFAFKESEIPTEATIVAIVDEVQRPA
jgi:ethanolamine utilization protein EutN